MRLSAVIIAFLALATPVTAAEPIADQAERAYALFAGGLAQNDFLGAKYGQALFSGIAGKWVHLDGPNPKTGVETYGADTDRLCKTPETVSISSPNPLTLAVETHLAKTSFNQTFVLIAGSTFGESTEALQYLTAVGLGPERVGANFDQQRALALSLVNGLVQIYRPSLDILVLARDRGYPIVFARCPG